MEDALRHACIYGSRFYPDGYKFHGYIRDMVCEEGKWRELDKDSSDSKVSLAYIYH
jgi:hypothetical protein